VFVLFPASVQWHIHDFSKVDAECDIAEQSEAKKLTESINWLIDRICKDAPQLCIDPANRSHSITKEAIDRAESYSKDRFTRLSQEQVRKVRNVMDSQLEHLN
jgi:hypothetical protein